MENKLHAIVGGPNCRSRSVLRHYKVPGQPNCPPAIRAWGGGEYGIDGLTEAEQSMIQEDDLLLWRIIFLAMVSNYIKEARKDPGSVVFTLDQPASPKDYMPETVSFWATKPTTFGGNWELEVNNHKRVRKAGEAVEIKSSKDLSRWPLE